MSRWSLSPCTDAPTVPLKASLGTGGEGGEDGGNRISFRTMRSASVSELNCVPGALLTASVSAGDSIWRLGFLEVIQVK